MHRGLIDLAQVLYHVVQMIRPAMHEPLYKSNAPFKSPLTVFPRMLSIVAGLVVLVLKASRLPPRK